MEWRQSLAKSESVTWKCCDLPFAICDPNHPSMYLLHSQEENPPGKIHPINKKVHLNREGRSSRELFERVCVNAVSFWYFGILGWIFGPLFMLGMWCRLPADIISQAILPKLCLVWIRRHTTGVGSWPNEIVNTLVATIRVRGVDVFAWMEWMSEAFARDCQVKMWLDKTSLLRCRKIPEWRGNCPKHHLGENCPSKGQVGEYSFSEVQFSLWGIIFSWKIAFPFPQNGLFSHEAMSLSKREFLWQKRDKFNYDFAPRGKIYLKQFFCLKRSETSLKALETTTAMKRRNILCTFCSDCAVFNLSLHGRCISPSLQDSAKVAISRLLARNCCGLAVVVSAIFASQWWPGGEVVISRSLPLWDLGRRNWDTQKS